MANVLVFGAGRSAGSLLLELSAYCRKHGHVLVVCDAHIPSWLEENGIQHQIFLLDHESSRKKWIEWSDIVLSLMPPALHLSIIHDCIQFRKHFINASYLSPEIEALRPQIEATGKLFLTECGLDPGIDHMSALAVTKSIKEKQGVIQSFTSFTGGLIAPESDTNPWHYKISWNPRNVVLAGQGTARFKQEGSPRLLPYHQLFSRTFSMEVPGLGTMEGYPNRDSVSYMPLYGMEEVSTFIRGTLRYPGYCAGWNALLQLGLTDDQVLIPEGIKTWSELLHALLPHIPGATVSQRLSAFLSKHCSSDPTLLEQLHWLDLTSDRPLPPGSITPAMALQALLEDKWKLSSQDRDLIAMQHEWIVQFSDGRKKIKSTLLVKGKNQHQTAMAQTVGLPMFIAARLLAEGQLSLTGLHRPLHSLLFEPILKALESYGIHFSESEEEV
jgi:saccharopine dehydrogenase (NADP+, L-glutamate forming)